MDITDLFGSPLAEAAGAEAARAEAAGAETAATGAGVADVGLSLDDLFASPLGEAGLTGESASVAGLGFAAHPVGGACGSGPGYSSKRTACAADRMYDDDSCSNDSEEEAEDLPSTPGVRLWCSREVHPNGVRNWRDTPNCIAALEYKCACEQTCLSRVGGAINLYDYRRLLRQRATELGHGGLRDAIREVLAAHYDAGRNQFRRSFSVGNAQGVCERAAGVAMGVSESLFGKARADVTKDRPWHAGRKKVKVARQSKQRESLDAWVRRQRAHMEGDKLTGARWQYSGKLTEKELWMRYMKDCDRAGQPTHGSSRLLWDIWKSHTEIKERPPTGHEACNSCAERAAKRASLEGLTDAVSNAARKQIDDEQRAHISFNSQERKHYTDAVSAAELDPHSTTTLTIDAPTRHQFDLPSQARSKRDVAKRLDQTNRWQSKIEGVLDAGVGMMVYVARAALGGGANLVCTVLMLSLFCHHRLGRPLGRSLHLQLDNTTAENKNTTVFGLVAWLVARGIFDEGVIFYMHVGHTYNDLDQTFAPLIAEMLRIAIESVAALLAYLERKLTVQRVREVRDLPHLWDFAVWLAPCMHEFKGFATTQHSSGMHEFIFRRDSTGEVRVHYRQTSQSSTLLPEGPGDLIFKSLPSGHPPVAAFKADEVWHRAQVQCNVRQWLPHLGLPIPALGAAEKSWQELFDSMPPSSQDLPTTARLVWDTLPAQQQPLCATQCQLHACTDMIENPPVNPVATHQHNQGAVARETAQWQRSERAVAIAAGRIAPIFHSEYVFFKPPDATSELVSLGRVVSVPYGGATMTDHLLDIAEYAHTPMLGVCGLFGTFVTKQNEHYDAATKGSLKFVRHKGVKRSHVLHANVQTWLDADRSLRISLVSLQKLATLCPQEHKLPATIPSLHAAQDRIATRTQTCDAGVRVTTQDIAGVDNPDVAPGRQGATTRQPTPQQPVPARTRIVVYWEEDGGGWYKGTATSHRRSAVEENSQLWRWQTRVAYDDHDGFHNFSAWHFLDGGDESAKWRICDSSDEDESE